jgi:hypothetical protein
MPRWWSVTWETGWRWIGLIETKRKLFPRVDFR